jgi:hypothetical protein
MGEEHDASQAIAFLPILPLVRILEPPLRNCVDAVSDGGLWDDDDRFIGYLICFYVRSGARFIAGRLIFPVGTAPDSSALSSCVRRC